MAIAQVPPLRRGHRFESHPRETTTDRSTLFNSRTTRRQSREKRIGFPLSQISLTSSRNRSSSMNAFLEGELLVDRVTIAEKRCNLSDS